MDDTPKRAQGRPRRSVIERPETGIAFIDVAKACGLLPSFLSFLDLSPSPCEVCCFHAIVTEAQRLIKRVHENNLQVFQSHRGGNRRGKRGLFPALLRPWLDGDGKYPFNSNRHDSERRRRIFVSSGPRNLTDNKLFVDEELGKFNPDGVDWELVGVPDNGAGYSILFERDRVGRRTMGVSTEICLPVDPPMTDEAWGRFLKMREQFPEDFHDGICLPPDKERYFRVANFGDYFGERIKGGTISAETFESQDFLERGIALALIKYAQGGAPENGIEEARDTLKRLFKPVADDVALAFYNATGSSDINLQEIEDTAWNIAEIILVGDSTLDLQNEMESLEDTDKYRIFRYHVEWGIYWAALNIASCAVAIHKAHNTQVGEEEKACLQVRQGECLNDLYKQFDPYSWVFYNQPVFDITSVKAVEDLIKIRRTEDDGSHSPFVALQNRLKKLPKKHFILFGRDTFDPASGGNAVAFFRRRLEDRLKDWRRKRLHSEMAQQKRESFEADLDKYLADKGIPETHLEVIRSHFLDGVSDKKIVADLPMFSEGKVKDIIQSYRKYQKHLQKVEKIAREAKTARHQF